MLDRVSNLVAVKTEQGGGAIDAVPQPEAKKARVHAEGGDADQAEQLIAGTNELGEDAVHECKLAGPAITPLQLNDSERPSSWHLAGFTGADEAVRKAIIEGNSALKFEMQPPLEHSKPGRHLVTGSDRNTERARFDRTLKQGSSTRPWQQKLEFCPPDILPKILNSKKERAAYFNLWLQEGSSWGKV